MGDFFESHSQKTRKKVKVYANVQCQVIKQEFETVPRDYKYQDIRMASLH